MIVLLLELFILLYFCYYCYLNCAVKKNQFISAIFKRQLAQGGQGCGQQTDVFECWFKSLFPESLEPWGKKKLKANKKYIYLVPHR